MMIVASTTFVIKIYDSSAPISFSLGVASADFKSSTEISTEPPYWSLQFVQKIRSTTLGQLHDKLPLPLQNLNSNLTLKCIINYRIILTDITFFTTTD